MWFEKFIKSDPANGLLKFGFEDGEGNLYDELPFLNSSFIVLAEITDIDGHVIFIDDYVFKG